MTALSLKEARLSLAICQPHYVPWIGYYEMIDRVDTFIFLDDAQFTKGGWQNRNRIRKTATADEPKWFTVPLKKFSLGTPITGVYPSSRIDWIGQNLDSLRESYARTPFFEAILPRLEAVLRRGAEASLADLNIALIQNHCEELGITTRLLRSSQMDVPGKREARLLRLCQAVGADYYLANNATGEYVGPEYFAGHDITFALQNYTHPEYEQRHGETVLPFMSHLSILDVLFNQGERSLAIMRQGNPDA